MTEQYAKRKIAIRILANKGTKEEKEINLEGLRCSCRVETFSSQPQGVLHLKIWGMTLEQMDGLTVFGPIMQERRYNEITVSAGDDGGKMALVYVGCIHEAYANMNSAPNVSFNIFARSGAYDQTRIVKGKAHNGGVDVAVIMADLAKEMGKTIENNGVSVILRDRTYTGTALTQAIEAARDAQININVDRNTLAIWPKDKYRKNEPVEISAKTGMVGYPAFSGQGVMCTTLFNPEIACGRPVKVESTMKVASGTWNPVAVFHILESEIPSGAWFTQVYTYGKGLES